MNSTLYQNQKINKTLVSFHYDIYNPENQGTPCTVCYNKTIHGVLKKSILKVSTIIYLKS